MRAAIDDGALDALFREGRSYNGYLDEPVATEQLHQIWELMKWGPTSANQMPARLAASLGRSERSQCSHSCRPAPSQGDAFACDRAQRSCLRGLGTSTMGKNGATVANSGAVGKSFRHRSAW